ncbi:dihydroorotase [Peptostreptococcus equinus]|uniref:Dihydroorotase n=1 Tax=Peptostreptococcus equinus TaxID=3003601 RepID=A0ABY7JQR9_9FIRM|nr:dihydroorotase [Peptostreptococcus sp. CBA3647]WAW15701.1 dihydroorotase [Peptostreptococcus sp. CBA3647]
MRKLLIKNGLIINPANSFEEIADLLIENGIVSSIAKEINDPHAQIINAKGYIVCPGLIDIHAHFREPGQTHKEDIISGSKAAAAGGFTSVLLMANTNPKTDSVQRLKNIQKKAELACINIYQESALTYDFKDMLVDMEALSKNGAIGFTNDGVPVMNTSLLRKAMIKAKELDTIIALHEEDNSLISNHGINESDVAKSLSLIGAPRVAEDVMVARDCMLALDTGAKIDIQHISSGVSVDFVRYIKSLGANVIAEATPHHFTLTEDDVKKYSTLAKMNPPLRTHEDREKIIQGLIDDTIEIIATDHAPHTKEEKETEFSKAPSGIIGLETALSLSVDQLVNTGRLSMSHMLSKLTINPSKHYKLDRGDISHGKVADICIFNPNEEYVVTDKFYSKSSNSPFINWKLPAKIKYTICSGKIVYSDSDLNK